MVFLLTSSPLQVTHPTKSKYLQNLYYSEGVPVLNEDTYYTMLDISKLTGLHKNTVRRWVLAGKLKGERVQRGGYEVWVVRGQDLYHSGIPKLHHLLLPQDDGSLDPHQENTATSQPTPEINLSPRELLDRLQELSMKVGGYENATLALKETQGERDEYRRKYNQAQEETISVKGELADFKAEVAPVMLQVKQLQEKEEALKANLEDTEVALEKARSNAKWSYRRRIAKSLKG